MKNVLICASLLSSMLTFAQENDTIKSNNNIDEVIVTGYITKNSESANKMPLKDIENPQVYNTVNKNVIKEQVATNINDALKNVTGIARLWESTGRGNDGGEYYTMRGFSLQPTLLNGMPAFNNGTIDPAGIETIEAIKGPSGTLYGGSVISYGGLLNVITKRPYNYFGGEVGYVLGSYGLNRITADVNAPVGKNLYARINAAYQKQNSFQDAGSYESIYVAPSLKYVVNNRLTFTINTEIKKSDASNAPMIFLSRYSPLSFNSIDLFEQNYKKSYTSNDLSIKNTTFNIQAQANYKISDNWISQTIVSRGNTKTDGYNQYLWDSANGDEFTRYISKLGGETNTTGIQQNFVGNFNVGKVKNKLLFGLDYFQRQFLLGGTGWAGFGTVSLVNQTDTKAGELNQAAVNTALASTQNAIGTMETKIYSAYISDVVYILPNLSAMLSARVDHFTGNPTAYAVEESKATTTFSPKLGLVYQPIQDKLSIFANYMNGFQNIEPVQNVAADGSKYFAYFDPEHANQWEVGTKASLVKDKLSITASYYDIKVKDKVMPDPTNAQNSIQGGEVESKGFEVSVVGSPIDGLNIIAGFSHNDSEVTVGDPTYVGYRPEEAGPKNLFNFWANYKVQQGALKNIGIGFGANSASEHYTLNRASIGTFAIPSYAVFNAALSYNEDKYSVILKLDNIANKKYFSGWSTVTPQRLRTVSLSLNYKF
ncbi:TonB-dependent siderophore receptor [Chryseobacterium shandongense]|uniref:TonB-dependent siderophore receptor n=1 Tax=Chryseobacterium shandongense TaxID=1493872 RepID=A0AAD0YF83_9FLAO|nr:TonB-dependent siderophore receptor [Chryseobacterium shandongense]AZA87414.1 TonB-dependent siderophore receptor [Chryseobacterium shandongense]AZA95915.1 TonB-dependent siderophore receptor [Chryseobacterium shandongense]